MLKTRLSKLRNSARQRNIRVNLDVNKYQVLIDSGCHFCGNNLSEENGYCLDRIDSDKPYIISNVVACCKICNRAKSNLDYNEFINWLDRAYVHIQKNISSIKEFEALGINKELYIQLEEEFYKEMNKGKDKFRITYNPGKE